MALNLTRTSLGSDWLMKAHALILGGLVVLPLIFSGSADAASCKTMAGWLRGKGKTTTYSRQIAQQKAHIQTMKRRLSRAGCGTRRANRPTCASNALVLKKMQRNLARLYRKNKQSAHGSKASIRRTMRKKGCFREASVHKKVFEDKKTAKHQRKKRTRMKVRQTRKAMQVRQTRKARTRISRTATLSTYCVRKSDGFYIPVSFATRQQFFERDREACERRCPGQPAELFYHRTRYEFPEDMVAAKDGRPYADLENAFKFRETKLKDAGCDFSKATYQHAFESINIPPAKRTLTQVAMLARPKFRPGVYLLRGTVTPRRSTLPPTQKRIRVVGDAFFPVQ